VHIVIGDHGASLDKRLRPPMIHSDKLCAILAGRNPNLKLRLHRGSMRFAQRGQLSQPRPNLDAARAAVKAHVTVGRVIVNDGAAIHVVNNGHVHVIDRAIVKKMP
jgi:hypothetical protein